MFKALLVLSVLISGSVFAQDMSRVEDYKNSYVEMPDGGSRYVGKCSTHEDYEDFYFKTKKVIQKYVSPGELSENQIRNILAKFDDSLIKQVLTTLDMYDIAESDETEVDILKDYIDDFTAETISHVVYPDLDLIRFNVGVGGGNGGYMIFNKVKKDSKVAYELMSSTFDGDLNFCDRKVWLQNIQ